MSPASSRIMSDNPMTPTVLPFNPTIMDAFPSYLKVSSVDWRFSLSSILSSLRYF